MLAWLVSEGSAIRRDSSPETRSSGCRWRSRAGGAGRYRGTGHWAGGHFLEGDAPAQTTHGATVHGNRHREKAHLAPAGHGYSGSKGNGATLAPAETWSSTPAVCMESGAPLAPAETWGAAVEALCVLLRLGELDLATCLERAQIHMKFFLITLKMI